MSQAFVIAGTDTNIGKTIFSAALAHALDGAYWKPIQAGLGGETDSECVARLSKLGPDRIVPEAYRLRTPASPHYAAEQDGIRIDTDRLTPPRNGRPLVIELAGGLMVPLTREHLQIDVLTNWKLPVILVSSTRLGTINHTLMSIEVLKRRAVPILGVAFSGDANVDSEHTIAAMGRVTRLGRLPRLEPLTPDALASAFAEHFDLAAVLGLGESGP